MECILSGLCVCVCVWYVRMVFQHFLDRHWERKKEKNPKEIKSMPNERVTHTHQYTHSWEDRNRQCQK